MSSQQRPIAPPEAEGAVGSIGHDAPAAAAAEQSVIEDGEVPPKADGATHARGSRRVRPPAPAFEGVGYLRGPGFGGEVRYAIRGDPTALRRDRPALRAGLFGAPDLVEQAFRAGSGTLTLEGGAELRLKMLGHTTEGHEVFVEVYV